MNTTIRITEDTKHLLKTFGKKGETYETILKRLYHLALKEQLHDLLLSSKDTLPIDEAIIRAKKRWQK